MPIKRGTPQLPVTEQDIRADKLRELKLEQAQSDANKRGSVYMRMTILHDGRIRSLSSHISLVGGPRLKPEELAMERSEGWQVEILEITPEGKPPRPAPSRSAGRRR